jgi:cytochrome b
LTPIVCTESESVAVWDRAVRVFHWALAASAAVAAILGFFGPRNALNLHLAEGTTAAALVLFRCVWGFCGPTYARFASFVFPPRQWLARARDRSRYLGHNPRGGAMIVALLATVAALGVTGLLALGGVDKQGPAAFATSYATGKLWLRAHGWLAYGLLALVATHIAGVLAESRLGGENLVAAMTTGRKRLTAGAIVLPEVPGWPWLAAVLVGAALATSVGLAWSLMRRPALGAPVAAVDPTYAKECGSCHMAYPPSLAPRALWRGVIGGLAEHFGEDASLNEPTRAQILDYLLSHAAETADTRAANEMRETDASAPLRLTATPFWRRTHAEIDASVFKSKAVGAQGACYACHLDAASGRFDPQAIALPFAAPP